MLLAKGRENPRKRPVPGETQIPLVQDMYATGTSHVHTMRWLGGRGGPVVLARLMGSD
jgi:hypothetical protein